MSAGSAVLSKKPICPPSPQAAWDSARRAARAIARAGNRLPSFYEVKRCAQCAVCDLVGVCLCRALSFLSRRDSRIQAEAARWPRGKTLRMEVPGASGFTVTGGEEGFKVLPRGTRGDVTIRFKSPADAFRVFTGQISVAQAYAQHRFTLRGNIGMTMPLLRCVDLVEGYLFPAFLAKRILKRLPDKEVSTARVYGAVLFGR